MDYSLLIDRIYEAAAVPGLWPAVLQETGRVASATTSILFSIGANDIRTVCSPGGEQMIEAYYAAEWHKRNDRIQQCIRVGQTGFMGEAQVYDLDAYRKEPVYNEFLAPHRLGWAAATAAPVPTGDMLVFSYERNFRLGPPDADTLQRLDLLRPHLVRAGMLSSRLAMDRSHTAVLALEHAGLPACMIGRDLRLVAANTLFEPLLRDGVVQDRRQRMTLADDTADASFLNAMTRLVGGGSTPPVCSIAIPATEDTAALVLHLLPIKLAANDIFSGVSALCVVTTAGAARAASTEVLQGLYGLTPAEANVARLVAEGETVETIAMIQNRSDQTVRTQLKSVFAKTGVARQTDLALLLSGLSLPVT
jgi:DNA-binding CsgD family transcriptional regulator